MDICSTWEQEDNSRSEVYHTDCGQFFVINDGTPKENGMNYCCFCGKELKQILAEEESE